MRSSSTTFLLSVKMIAAKEQVEAEDAALALLAEAGDGSMRDALSIMDQAIASRPSRTDARALRSADSRVDGGSTQRGIRATAGGRGCRPERRPDGAAKSSRKRRATAPRRWPARWWRYLRNALMARLGGEHTELLQISGDERARAARTALLFTEEDLTRQSADRPAHIRRSELPARTAFPPRTGPAQADSCPAIAAA